MNIIPLLLLNLIWMKVDSSGGGKERRIELGVQIYGRGDRIHEYSELTLKKSNSLINNNMRLFSYIRLFYRVEKIERLG